MKKLFLILITCLLAACNPQPKLDGTYVSSTVDRTITFQPNGMAFESTATTKFPEFPYRIEGDSIKAEGRIYQLKLLPDGSIDGGAAYGKMTKK